MSITMLPLENIMIHNHENQLCGEERSDDNLTVATSSVSSYQSVEDSLSAALVAELDDPREPEDDDDEEEGKKTRSRIVSFNSKIHIAEVSSKDQYSEDEKESIWYSLAELDQIQRSCCHDAAKRHDKQQRQGHESCVRGLETYFREQQRARYRWQFQAIKCVIHEQEKQIAERTSDPVRIRELYHDASVLSCDEAIRIASADAETAAIIAFEQADDANASPNCCFFFTSIVQFILPKKRPAYLANDNR